MSLHVNGVSKTFESGRAKVEALKDVDISVAPGEFVVVLGPSGSGKSTLLNVIGGLERPEEGSVSIEGDTISSFDEKRLMRFRREGVGFIFQQYHLLGTLNVSENVETGAYKVSDRYRNEEIIERVGLSSHARKYPHELSGGEQQRVSIARALVKKPALLLCDEPTGSLDESTGKSILSLLQTLHETLSTTIVLVTHNVNIAGIADRVIKMSSGRIVEDFYNKEKVDAHAIRWH